MGKKKDRTKKSCCEKPPRKMCKRCPLRGLDGKGKGKRRASKSS